MKLATLLVIWSALSISFLTKVFAKELNINYDVREGGPTVYEVENNTLINISFKYLNWEACDAYLSSKRMNEISTFSGGWSPSGNSTDSAFSIGNFRTGFNLNCEWIFLSEIFLRDTDFIKLVNSTRNLATETYSFQFEINNLTSEDVFPLLVFAMGEKSGFSMYQYYYETVIFRLKQPTDINVDFDDVSALEKETGTKEIEVVKDDFVEVRMERISKLSPDFLSYYWYLENADEIRSSNALEPLNLLENRKSSDSVSNIVNSIEMRETGCVYDVFKFKITGEEPSQSTLTFALLDRVDHEPVAKAEVILYMNGNEKKIIIKDLEYTVSKDERNQVVQVENNSVVTIHVKNASDRCKLQENSECEWYFVKGDLDSYGYIDYLGSTYTQEKDTYDFKFKFENLTAADVLPNLEFSYGPVSQSRSDVTPVDTLDAVVVHLANVGQVDLIFNYNIYDFMKDTIRKELKVKRNSIVQIQLSKTCFSTNGIDYHWYLLGFNEDENLGALNLEGTIKENQFPLPPGSCKDEVFKFRVKGRATEPLPTLKFVHHEEGKMVDPQYVYVQLKMTSEGEEEKPLKELDVYYDSEKTIYDIEEGSYMLNVHIKNLPKNECSALLANASVDGENNVTNNNVQCQWRMNDEHYYKDVKPRYYFLDYRGRTYEQETDSFVFKFQINNLKTHNFFPYLFFYYGPSSRNFKDSKPENYFKPLRLQMAIPGAMELILKDLPTENNETTKKEILVQNNDIIHVMFEWTSVFQWTLTSFINSDSLSDIAIYDGGVCDIQPFWVKESPKVSVYDLCITDEITSETLQPITFTYQRSSTFVLNAPKVNLIFKLKEGKVEDKIEKKEEERVKDEEEVKKDEEKKGEKVEEDDQCMKDTGYPCCQKTQTVATVDNEGSWGIEDGHWCLLTSSKNSADDYPLCTSTKTVVYVSPSDDSLWGVENNEWCIINE